MRIRLIAAALLAGLSSPTWAGLTLPHLFSDHAVLQRERPIHVWGWATAGVPVTVALHRQRVVVTADRLGRWDAWLTPEAAGGPYALTVDAGADGRFAAQDVMLGDVWFASGQSNMEMPLAGFPPSATIRDGAAEIAAATNPRIRLLRPAHRSSMMPLGDTEASWTTTTPTTAAPFSAIGYFFAREIAARQKVTVGVIDSTWGGTPADSWVSLDSLADPALVPAFVARAKFQRDQADAPRALAAEAREDAAIRSIGGTPPPHDWHPPEDAYRPAGLFNAMVAPFTGYGIRGVIWYQGETNSNVARAPYYETLFKTLITDWRRQWGQGDFPFLFAQISSFDSPREYWGLVRDAQRRALSLTDTAIVVTTDVGDPANVHPSDKQTVAARLALAARGLSYGEPVAYRPPLFRQATGEGAAMRIWFDQAKGLTSRGGAALGFEIAGADHRFVPATARIEGETVLAAADAVPQPRYVRYNWSNVTTGLLANGAGLPAPTFTSEDRPEMPAAVR